MKIINRIIKPTNKHLGLVNVEKGIIEDDTVLFKNGAEYEANSNYEIFSIIVIKMNFTIEGFDKNSYMGKVSLKIKIKDIDTDKIYLFDNDVSLFQDLEKHTTEIEVNGEKKRVFTAYLTKSANDKFLKLEK